MLVPTFAITAPLDRTEEAPIKTLVTLPIKKLTPEMRIYVTLMPRLLNLLTISLPSKSGPESATTTLNFFFFSWASAKTVSRSCTPPNVRIRSSSSWLDPSSANRLSAFYTIVSSAEIIRSFII